MRTFRPRRERSGGRKRGGSKRWGLLPTNAPKRPRRGAPRSTPSSPKGARAWARENLPNEFEAPDNVALIERLAGAEPALELHALKVGERIVSVFGGLCAHGRLSGLIFSHDISEDVAAASPGELILAEIVRDAIRRNLAEFDLGVGEARYKSECCEVAEPLIDAAFAATFFGRVAASLFLQMRALKRRVKRSPRFLELARRAQRWDFRLRVR